MLSAILQFIGSAAVIIVAGTFLVKFADHIADITKLGKLLVGSLFLAAATSLPELFVDISAVRNHDADIAVGDLFGSSLFNLLILAIGDLLHKGGSNVFTREAGAHALSASMSITITAVAGIAIFMAPQLVTYSVGNIGVGTLVIVTVYLFSIRMIYFDQKISAAKSTKPIVEDGTQMSLKKALTGYLVSAIFILVAAPFLAGAASKIAELSGLGKTFVGTTLVALSTSLPELVSTIVAIRLGSFDLAAGNIFGSNSFNMLILVPLDFFHGSPILASVSRMHVFTSLAVILITSITVMGQLYQVEKRKRLIEPDAFVVISLVLVSLFILYVYR